MSIADQSELIDGITLRLGSNSGNVSDDGYVVGAETAMAELGWDYPLSHPLKVFWAFNRGVRHCIFILQIESAHKYRYKDIFLQNRFTHYSALIEKMDKDFEKAKGENPDMFFSAANADAESIISSICAYIPNIRDYDIYGNTRR